MSRVETREYERRKSVVFRKTAEKFGGLSNMAPGFPIAIDGVRIRTSEALYQACRFPHLPEVQRLIINEGSPMAAKMRSKTFRDQSRSDWDSVRVKVMRWCLRVKLAQNWESFGRLLRATGDHPIVEESTKDDFWGAHPLDDAGLVGANVLGRLLMELRQDLLAGQSAMLQCVEPLSIPEFLLYGKPIGPVAAEGRLPAPPKDEVQRPPVASLHRSAAEQSISAMPLSQERSGTVMFREAEQAQEAKITRYPRRLIEVDLPIKRISMHARREKSIRHGHISTLHIWWARRPLAACRAVMCAALWPDPADPRCPADFYASARTEMLAWTSHERQRLLSEESRRHFEAARQNRALFNEPDQLRLALLDFIADFANWDRTTVREYLDTSRTLTQAAHEALGGAAGTRPLVVDPFAGGGSIPLEALRVGADAFASDLNPVPVLLNKVVLEYIPKYGERLAVEVRTWGEWIKQEAERELAQFYPPRNAASPPLIAYFWARTVISGAPDQGTVPVEVPLLRSMWLSKKGKRRFALRWSRDGDGTIRSRQGTVRYSDGSELTVRQPLLEVFQPRTDSDVESGTSKGGSATCPITNFTTPVEGVRSQLLNRRGGASDARLVAVVAGASAAEGRRYRLGEQEDEEAFIRARERFAQQLSEGGHKVTLPDGQINHLRGFFNIVLYGMEHWGDLFSMRQALVLTTFGRLVVELKRKLTVEAEMATAVQTCLALAVDRLAEKLTSLARWDVTRENPQGTFGRQALPMVWDFCEVNPFSGAGGDWSTALDWVAKVLEGNVAMTGRRCGVGHVEQASATAHPLPNDSAAAVFTDPPYYAAVPYADLSDFFYSWLRQTIGESFPTMFSESLAPKAGELVSLSHRAAMYREKTGAWFEARMAEACAEARRVCEPGGVGIFVFANKETAGWEAMLSALVNSGWTITASWPIDTEMGSRLRAQNSAVLASSVHLVCRPRENHDESERKEVGDWRDVLQELPTRIHAWMPRLVVEGVVGADAIFACLGPALEIFSRYSRVEKASGEPVKLKEYLEHVWAAVAREALATVLQDSDSGSLEPDARLTVIWLWTLGGGNSTNGDDTDIESDDAEEDDEATVKTPAGYVLEFDAARKIAQGLGANLEALGHVVVVKGDKARLLAVADRTQYLFGKTEGAPAARRAPKKKQISLFAEIEEVAAEQGWGDVGAPKAGTTTLDRVHQAMLLFASARGEALKRFLVEEGIGRQAPFWKLSQALAALYPSGSEERRWVEGVLARKKGLGFG